MEAIGSRTRLAVIGGFLGAGKTSALLGLARRHALRGRRVGLIVNDPSHALVDTARLRSAGWAVEELGGACLCGTFSAFLAATERLERKLRPDLILVEPPGSCVDLRANLLRPLQQLYPGRFQLAPHIVLLDPLQARAMLADASPHAADLAYLYAKQAEEADLLVLNKVDLLEAGERTALSRLLADQFPAARHLALSIRKGEGFAPFFQAVTGRDACGTRGSEVDYRRYARGEASLAWLNACVRVERPGRRGPFAGSALLAELDAALVARLGAAGQPIHLKLHLRGATGTARTQRVGQAAPELASQGVACLRAGTLLVNARGEMEPAAQQEAVEQVLDEAAERLELELNPVVSHVLRPGRRLTAARLPPDPCARAS